jgi:penicillin amidase
MRRLGRLIGWLIQLVAMLVVLAIIALVVMGAITTQRGWPQTTGTIAVKGLHDAVTVVRDGSGIIQLTADDPHDLFFGQGYVHAQERMWQMEISRRIGAGRLSELFGKSQLDTDSYIRTLGWRVAAEHDLDAMSPDALAILKAYSDGVNAWIDEHNGDLSVPFVVAGLLSGTGGIGGIELEPWTPLDTATWQKVQAWSLGGNVDSEIFRLLADAKLGDPKKTDELFPAYPGDAPVITPAGVSGKGGSASAAPRGRAAASSGRGPVVALSDAHVAALGDLARLGTGIATIAGLDRGEGILGSHGVGSNNWVVSGDRTTSGKPILANDPHLGFGMPSVWIMNGLHCRKVDDACPWNVVGVSFPGAPAVILGHNAQIAWGATNVNPDTQDLFLETPDVTDPDNYYMADGKRVAYDVRKETIKVAGRPDVTLNVRSTRHGVVLSDVDERLKDGPVLAMRWTATAEVDATLESFFKIDVAQSFDDFKKAFETYGSPSQNFVYADVDGHIGYVLPGLVPIRDTAAALGDRVRDGASGKDEWVGYVDRKNLPWQLDPKSGQIVSANNQPVSTGYDWWLGNEYDPGYRAARISAMIEAIPGKIDASDMREVQKDTYVLRADTIMPLLEKVGPITTTQDGRLLWQAMVNWDRQCTVDSLGCTAYITSELAIQRALFDDELGSLAREYVGSTFSWQALIEMLGKPDSAWWQDTTPGRPEGINASATIGSAIDSTAAALRAAYGEPANWTWGQLHTVQFKESTLGSSGILPLELYFDPPARPVAGADGAINNNYYRVSRAYADPNDPDYVPLGITELYGVTNGPSYRFTIDMNDLNGAQIMITTGQSGNPFDGHYGDLIPLWLNGDTVFLPFSPENIAASASQTLTLTPQ